MIFFYTALALVVLCVGAWANDRRWKARRRHPAGSTDERTSHVRKIPR